MKRFLALLLSLPLVLVLTACPHKSAPALTAASATTTAPAASGPGAAYEASTKGNASASTASTLGRYHWRLAKATDQQGQRIDALFANAHKPLQLDFHQGRLTVSRTCNRMGGSYHVTDGSLDIGPMLQTMKACPDGKLMVMDAVVDKLIRGKLAMTLKTRARTPRLTLVTAHGSTLVFTGQRTTQTR